MKINNLFIWLKQKPRIAFFMCLPLILMVACLIIYPFFYSIFLATLNKAETKFVGFANFLFLFKRETFWLVVQQSIFFALVAVFFKALIGFIAAHSINAIPSKGQRKWRGMLLIPWVIPPALSTLGWWWLFEPTYSALNWLLGGDIVKAKDSAYRTKVDKETIHILEKLQHKHQQQIFQKHISVNPWQLIYFEQNSIYPNIANYQA